MKNKFLVVDQNVLPTEELFYPFALTDILTEYSGENDQLILHFWQMEKAFILGMKDTRVANLQKGLQRIHKNGYTPVIRNSGGLGVIADTGILNVSLILPSPEDKKISIDFGYEAMLKLVREAFHDNSLIEAKEITTSYCPGKYDLSINDVKFAGIAQRRIKSGVAVMMYISLQGDQLQRGEVVKEFYEASLKTESEAADYPSVNPSSMANISDLIHEELSISHVKQALTFALTDQFQLEENDCDLSTFLALDDHLEKLTSKLANMAKRNQVIKEFTK